MSISDKLTAVAENMQKVYNAGWEAGGSYYDTFWDAFQQNGERGSYMHAFNDQFNPISPEAFKPKYCLYTTNCENMFKQLFNQYTCDPVDFVELFESLGLVFDTSKSTSVNYMFYKAKVKRVGVIDCTSTAQLNYTFADSTIETIEKLIVHENFTHCINPFLSCSKLVNITVEGTLALSINFEHCPLSVDSLNSIIASLKDFTGTGTTQTLTLGTTSLAKLTDAEKIVATQKGWTLA